MKNQYFIFLMTCIFYFSANSQNNVTFQVDMNNVDPATFTTPEVNGTFNGWCGSCAPMSDPDGDNIWDVTINLPNGSAEFKYSADNWSIQESLFSGDSCTVTASGYTNRTLNVSGDTTLSVVCWESCGPCGGGPSAYNVTFQVDMNSVTGFTTPEVNGTFNNWCGNCWTMSDADGDNIWDFTTLLAPGYYDFKYSADNWNIQESLDSSLLCVNTVQDPALPSGYATNRFFEVIASDTVLGVVPWGGCSSVSTPGCTDLMANNYNYLATTDDGSCMYDVTFTVDLNCESFTPGYVSVTGPSDGWSCGNYVLSDANGDGIWEGTFGLPVGDFEYIYCADGWANSEAADLIANNTGSGDWSCTPSTDYFSFANRLITVGSGIITTDTWGSCSACIVPTITSYTIHAGSYYYTPSSLSINVGDTVDWFNDGGYHDVNGNISSLTGASYNNPVSFYLPPTSGPSVIGSYVFTVPGIYNYDCSIGSHAANGMVGSIIVNSTSVLGCTDPLACNYNASANVDDGSCLTAYGCTDPTAINYNINSTCDDGSCFYGPVLSQLDLPVTWDDSTVDYTTTDFGGASSSLVQDPTNATNNVLQVDRTAGSQTWAGTTLGTPAGFATDIPLTLTSSTMSVTFWSPQAGVQVRLKVEDSSDPTHTCETEVTTTVANGWNTLVFDFLNEAPGTQPLSIGLGFGWTFNMASIFCDFGNVPSSSTIYYVDDVVFGGVAVVSGCTDPTANNYNANATVDDGSCSYGQSTYDVTLSVNTANITVGPNGMYAGGGVLGDAVAVPLSDPNGTGTWTGVVTLASGTTGNYIFLNSPANGGDWGAKEDLTGQACADPNNYNDRILPIILADTTLLHCFGSCESDGTCSVYGCTDPAANNYDANATVDDGSCFYGPVLSQLDLPVTWDDSTVDYTTTDFGGASSSLVQDPTNATNNVLQVDRTAGSQTWAGTTLGTPAGFATDIPLTLTSSTMSVTFWSPQAGVQVRLKVEDSSDPTHTCETEVTTTVANGWNTLVFDFLNEAPGTQPLSIGLGFGWTFNMASIFCDFGNVPSSSTIYYVDDVVFGGVAVSGCTDATACNYNALANTDDGSCDLPNGCGDPLYLEYDATVTCSDAAACLTLIVNGCTDATACNYNALANTDDGSCDLPNGCGDPLYLEYDATVTCSDAAACLTLIVNGCTDATACNYNALANTDDGSCDLPNGCGDPLYLEYDATVTCSDAAACLTFIVNGCTDPSAFNYDPLANIDDGSCIPYTFGCTNPNALNYNPTSNTDDGSCLYPGCIDSLATNYDPTANLDDGTCIYPTCSEDVPTGLFTSNVIHNRATINWDNMNSALCFVDQYRIQYREVGASSWSQKTMSGPVGSCNFASQKTDKLILNLTTNTNYEYQMKAWYCGGGASSWSGIETFTTLDNCPNVGSLAVYGATPTKATFTWDASNGVYSFVRLKARVDSISNPTGADFFQIGGAGVSYGTNTKNKNGLTPGETYRGQARTYCDPNGGPWKSLSWTSLVYWTQPTQRIEGGNAIAHLDVYPNPSKDVFNVTFTSEDVQDLEVRVINIVGDVIYTDNLQQFVGEYTKSIDLATYTKGVYFLEITTNNAVVNKKLILY